MSVKPKLPAGKGAKSTGSIGAMGKLPMDAPDHVMSPGLPGMNSLHNDIGEMSGFQGGTDSYIVKKGTPYGEGAKFNKMPPGMDIDNQDCVDIRQMPLKKITNVSYPGDGWEPAARDIVE